MTTSTFNMLPQLISYIGLAVIILAAFKRSLPDIAVIAAFGIFCIPTAINVLARSYPCLGWEHSALELSYLFSVTSHVLEY